MDALTIPMAAALMEQAREVRTEIGLILICVVIVLLVTHDIGGTAQTRMASAARQGAGIHLLPLAIVAGLYAAMHITSVR